MLFFSPFLNRWDFSVDKKGTISTGAIIVEIITYISELITGYFVNSLSTPIFLASDSSGQKNSYQHAIAVAKAKIK